MTSKGLATLNSLICGGFRDNISYIVTAKDINVVDDYHNEIVELATLEKIQLFERSQVLPSATHLIAVSWRWLIEPSIGQQLIVFHDSLLPRYRGFAPLPNALINGEKNVGVTALLASDEYDRGPIIAQAAIELNYPVKISTAIELLKPCYELLAKKIATDILQNNLKTSEQNECEATYSLWRDEADYFIDWNWDSDRIKRFVDALGFPFKGAATTIDGTIYRIMDCIELPDVNIENRDAGKIIFLQGKHPVVVCGSGLLKIMSMVNEKTSQNAIPLQKFRTRFI